MSKGGGAGKVYFVLYLAVVLELLIIIVDRDEAEDSLHQKQRESMQIVESILSQLQSGSGTEGINTRPQDEITMPPTNANIKELMGADIKSNRKYIVEVGVTDVSGEMTRKEGETDKEYVLRIYKLAELANVEEIEYQIFYSPSTDAENSPLFPTDEDLRAKKIDFTKFSPNSTLQGPNGDNWEFLSSRKLHLDKEAMSNRIDISKINLDALNPVYPSNKIDKNGPTYVPGNMPEDSAFFYSAEKTAASVLKGELKKRAFMVNFQPPRKAGWYKLRFSSRTNRILGVRADQKPEEINEETKVNIGTVQLTVRDLEKVRKELVSRLEKYELPDETILTKENDLDKFDQRLKKSEELAYKEEDAREIRSKIKLYGYICKLLAPGQSINFPQNQGAIEFNIRVVTPEPQTADPTVIAPTAVRCFDKLAPVFEFTISPYQGNNNISGVVKNLDGQVVASVQCRPSDVNSANGTITAANTAKGQKKDYIGVVDKILKPGKYSIEITHRLNSKTGNGSAELTVFPTGLTEDNAKLIKMFMESASYGNRLLNNQPIVPTSGGTIRPEEFRVYLTTDDAGSQRSPIYGLQISSENAPLLTPAANTASIKVTWKQPYTGQEVDLLPLLTTKINIKSPKINTGEIQTSQSSSGNKLRIRVSNIYIIAPPIDDNTKAKISVSAGQPSVDRNSKDLSMSFDGQPTVRQEGGSWVLDVSGTVSLPSGKNTAQGIIEIPLNVTASYKDKVSNTPKKISVQVKFEGEGNSRRGGSGGRRTR